MRLSRHCGVQKYLNCNRLVAFLVILTVLSVEYIWNLPYFLEWPSFIDNETLNERRHTRILLVADPQLIGYQREPKIGLVSRWDSDSYLSTHFSTVLSKVKPHLVIFLGDLFDEGSIATDDEFQSTVDRFRSIFPMEDLGLQRIYILGDNDIGGEGHEAILPERHLKYEASLKTVLNPRALGMRHYVFIEANIFNMSTKLIPTQNMDKTRPESVNIRVLVSHVPVTSKVYYPAAEDIFESVKPGLLFSAHDHVAQFIITHLNVSKKEHVRLFPVDQNPMMRHVQFRIQIDNPQAIIELQAPTCSYRMGTKNVGYGVTYIDTQDGEEHILYYGVVWLPNRFKQLAVYGFAVVLLTVLTILWKCCCAQAADQNTLPYHVSKQQ